MACLLHECIVKQQYPGAGILHRVIVLRQGPPGIQGHHAEAGPGNGEQQFVVAVAVESENTDPLTPTQPEAAQGPREAGHSTGEIGPAAAAACVGRCCTSRIQPRGPFNHCRQGYHAQLLVRQGRVVHSLSSITTCADMATARGVHASKVPLLPPELGGGQAAPGLESRGKR